MSGCGHDPLAIQAFCDGSLDALHAAEVERRIAACPDCAAERDRLLALRAALRGVGIREAAPEALKRRLLSVPEPGRTRRPTGAASWLWIGSGAVGGLAAAAAALVLVAGPMLATRDLVAELTASHVRSLQAAHLTDVATSDQHVVKPWFNGRLDYSPPVNDLKDRGFPLVGGRLDVIAGRSVAALVYRRGRHLINLFVWPGDDGGPASADTANGYHLRHWRAGGMNFWAVSDVNPADLNLFELDLKRTG